MNGRITLPQFESGIEIPPMGHARGGGHKKSMFEAWNIGDSVAFTNEEQFEAVRVRALIYAKRHPPAKFTTRHLENEWRIWRVA